jgi:hypothetical protein
MRAHMPSRVQSLSIDIPMSPAPNLPDRTESDRIAASPEFQDLQLPPLGLSIFKSWFRRINPSRDNPAFSRRGMDAQMFGRH